MNISYQELRKIASQSNPYGWRLKMVESIKESGIKRTARLFLATPKTVKKWYRRYLAEGLDGLLDHSRKPLHSPRRIPKENEEKIVELRKRRKNRISCWSLKEALNLPYSTSTIYRVLKSYDAEYHLLEKRKKKYQKKKNLREIKDKLKPFEKIQVDVKYLDDIPQYFSYYLKHKLPKYQFSARDEKTGATFISFGYENTNINAASFVTYLLEHLERHGITASEVTIQSDNGMEFAGPWCAKSESLFTYMIQKVYGGVHLRIPRGRPNVNADVETLHRIIEDHFYDLEEFSDKIDFLNKAYTYQLVFNFMRPNSYRQGKTPVKILNESNCQIDPAVLSLPPIILDYHSMLYLRKINPTVCVDRFQKDLLRGYNLTDSPEKKLKFFKEDGDK